MMKPEPYVPPELTTMVFCDPGKKGCKPAGAPLFGGGGDAAAGAKSDEELARELHAKMNVDEATN
jgi:hypothetical protein